MVTRFRVWRPLLRGKPEAHHTKASESFLLGLHFVDFDLAANQGVPTFAACQDSLREIQNQINRQVGCFPSSDPRLKNLKPASLPGPSPAPSAAATPPTL